LLTEAVGQAKAAIESIDAQVVVGFGGYVSTPAYLAARKLGVPIVIHEQNARPGLANRLGARWASEIGLTFPGARLTGAKVVGLPLRKEILRLIESIATDPVETRRAAATQLGLDPHLPTLLVTGGSSGAVSINQAASLAAERLGAEGIQILHITGRGKAEEVLAAVSGLSHYYVLEYSNQMDLAFASADLVLTRSGAGMVCELTALGIPAVYVPLPVGNGEQALNAGPVVKAGGGILIDDGDLNAEWIESEIPALLNNRERLNAMAEAAASVGVRDGAERVVDMVQAAVASRRRTTTKKA
jgi:undecaprenyldiphospho-muramoylpentapeptide beta-N-acetylglucosaminyltransferase